MDNLNVFKIMGRFITAQINAISQSCDVLDQATHASMGLESRLLVDAWNIQAALNSTNVCPA